MYIQKKFAKLFLSLFVFLGVSSFCASCTSTEGEKSSKSCCADKNCDCESGSCSESCDKDCKEESCSCKKDESGKTCSGEAATQDSNSNMEQAVEASGEMEEATEE